MGAIFGNFTRITTCSVCGGRGQIPKENCRTCKGEGKKKDRQAMDIEIPAGIKNGETVVLNGMGQAGFRGESAGDLYLRINVSQDPEFKRIGNDILHEASIKMTDAVLGAKINVPTLDGQTEIKIPSGIHDGEELRIKGAGVHGRTRGDQIVKIKIKIPQKLTGKAKQLLEELAEEI